MNSQLIRDWEENTKWFYPQDRLVMAYEEIDMLDVKKNIQLKLRKRKNE